MQYNRDENGSKILEFLWTNIVKIPLKIETETWHLVDIYFISTFTSV